MTCNFVLCITTKIFYRTSGFAIALKFMKKWYIYHKLKIEILNFTGYIYDSLFDIHSLNIDLFYLLFLLTGSKMSLV